MKLIVGLGNPGKEYEKTRHNAGFMCIDKVATACNLRFDTKKFKAELATGFVNGEKVILMKPQTYMNLSGEAVGACVRFYNIPIENICVLRFLGKSDKLFEFYILCKRNKKYIFADSSTIAAIFCPVYHNFSQFL